MTQPDVTRSVLGDIPRHVALSSGVRIVAMTLFFVLAALWFSRPLALHLGDALAYGTTPDVDYRRGTAALELRPSDIHQVLFHQWLFADNLRQGRSPLANLYEFGPLNSQKLHWLGVWGFPMQLLFVSFAWISPVLALNLVVLASYPLTGLVHYALLRACAVRPSLSFLGAALFTFALARRVQLFCGHMNGALYFMLSASALLYIVAIQRRSWAWAVAAGSSVFAWALGEWHMFYFSSLFFPLLVLAVLGAQLPGKNLRELTPSLLLTLPLLLGVGLGAAYLLWYRDQFIVGSTAEHRTWEDLAANSPDPSFLISEQRHLVQPVMFGSDVESAIAIGLPSAVALLGALIGLGWARRRFGPAGDSPQDRLQLILLPLLLLAGASFALLSTGAHGDRLLGLYSLLHRHLPHFDIIRVPGRMIYLVYFSLAMSLPIALERLLASLERNGSNVLHFARAASLAIVVLLSALPIASAPGVLLSGVLTASDFAPLQRALPPDEPVLLVPVYGADSSQSSLAEHFIVATQRSTLNGYAPNAPAAASALLEKLTSLNRAELAPELHRKLWKLGVRHVVYLKRVSFLREAGSAPDFLGTLVRGGILEAVAETDHYRLLRLRPPPA